MKKNNTAKLAICGIYLALTLVMIFIASVIPGMELSFMAITSVIAAFVIIEAGVRFGAVFYVAACILGLVIVPNKLVMLLYIMCFGLYPIIKYFAEKLPKAATQMAVKLIYFVIVLLIAYFALFEIFFGNLKLPSWMPTIVLIPFAIIMFVLLDFILSGLINIYFKKIHSRFNKS